MEELLKERKQLYTNINIINQKHQEAIVTIEQNIEQLNNTIYKLCEHKWVHDRQCAYDRMETYCTQCFLYLKKK